MNKYLILKVEKEYEEVGYKIGGITILPYPYTEERFTKDDIKVYSEEITYDELIKSMIGKNREYSAVKVVGVDIKENSQTQSGYKTEFLHKTKEVTLENVDDLLKNYVDYPNRMFN